MKLRAVLAILAVFALGSAAVAEPAWRSHTNASGNNYWLLSPGPDTPPTGWGNTGVGEDTLVSVTKGYLNTSQGYKAGQNLKEGINNVAVGAYAANSGVGIAGVAGLADSVWIGREGRAGHRERCW